MPGEANLGSGQLQAQGKSETITSMVRLMAVAIKMAGIPIGCPFHVGPGHASRRNQCSFDANG
jgi:hypothetical protein